YDKKYTVVFGDDHWKSGDVLRYGEPWRKLDGDPALFDFARDAESAQRHALAISIAGTPARLFGRVEDLRKAEGSSPALEGAAQQLVRVA
ncbi:hypothetical protein, partial [Escherichia coli]|uniref:hypothetical protein n=1 Tax=Escherichia coli TaxID=562 RepID=UPI0013D77A62